MEADGTTANSTQLIALGTYIRERRRGLGMTQTQLAERVGWAQERVSILENGKYGMPSVPSLSRLAWALDGSLFEMLQAAGFAEEHISSVAQASENGHTGTVLFHTLRRLLAINALTLKEALDQAADMVAEVMSADKVDAFIHEQESDTLVALGSSNTPMGRHQFTIGMNRMPVANGGREVEVFLTGKPYHSGNAREDPGMLVGITEGLGVQSLMTVCLEVAGMRRGVLVAESARKDLFTPEDLSFLETVATVVGTVVQRAELAEVAAAAFQLTPEDRARHESEYTRLSQRYLDLTWCAGAHEQRELDELRTPLRALYGALHPAE